MSAQRVQSATRLVQEQIFARHARRLQAVVSRTVRTSPANIEDACGFAWLQLVCHQPEPPTAFAWLCTTAVRKAVELDRRTGRAVGLDQVSEVPADPLLGPAGRLELIGAAEQIRAARLRPREARVLGLRTAGYSREEMAKLTGDSHRTIDRQLGRARRKLDEARRRSAEVA